VHFDRFQAYASVLTSGNARNDIEKDTTVREGREVLGFSTTKIENIQEYVKNARFHVTFWLFALQSFWTFMRQWYELSLPVSSGHVVIFLKNYTCSSNPQKRTRQLKQQIQSGTEKSVVVSPPLRSLFLSLTLCLSTSSSNDGSRQINIAEHNM